MSTKSQTERRFWVAVCADLSHQMGTPLSALIGWLAILPSLRDPSTAHDEMNRSLERLQLISERLGQIGAPSGFEPISLKEVLSQLRAFAEKRMSGGDRSQRVQMEIRGNPVAQAHPVLLPWALENFIKSSLDAARDAVGQITLRAFSRKLRVVVEIEVEGSLSPLTERIASPGGMMKLDYRSAGLAIGEYIIREIHGGRVVVKEDDEAHRAAIVVSINRAH